jgi:2-methylisocitrate lyase-like PEP mutase family enzyme
MVGIRIAMTSHPTTAERAFRFLDLHTSKQCFVIGNPHDAGTAKVLASVGYQALATTSAGLAYALGRPDGKGRISREETLANARAIVEATSLPVAADLENGFSHDPDGVAETIRRAAETGLVGGSIEDATGDADRPIYDFGLAVERVAAAAEAAHGLPFPFMFTARAENFLHGRIELDDTIRRLQAFEQAGADVLYAPGLPSLDAIRTLCASVSKPVNVLIGGNGLKVTVAELAAVGVARVSVGSAFSRAALGGFLAAAREVLDSGSIEFAATAMPYGLAQALMQD